MTTSTNAPATGLRGARKEQAAARKPAPAAPAKKVAPAKKAPAKKVAEKKVEKTTFTATATGRAGVTNTRTFTTEMHWAVDVAEPHSTNPRAVKGRVWGFFVDKAKAETAAAKLNATGKYDAIVVAAKSVTK